MTIRLTSRDLRLLRWINAVGFVTITHIADWLHIARPTAYLRAKKLVDHHYLLHQRIFHGAAGIYRVTRDGVQVSGSALPPLRKVPLASYHHDLLVTALSLILVKRFGGTYMPERELRHGDGLDRFGKPGHTPDGVLHVDDKRIAIEVELNRKSRRRRNTIFSHYTKCFDHQEVWYFCGNAAIARQIEPFIKKAPFIKTYLLADFLQSPECPDGRRQAIESC